MIEIIWYWTLAQDSSAYPGWSYIRNLVSIPYYEVQRLLKIWGGKDAQCNIKFPKSVFTLLTTSQKEENKTIKMNRLYSACYLWSE